MCGIRRHSENEDITILESSVKWKKTPLYTLEYCSFLNINYMSSVGRAYLFVIEMKLIVLHSASPRVVLSSIFLADTTLWNKGTHVKNIPRDAGHHKLLVQKEHANSKPWDLYT